jgi:hypothetical protein
MTCVLNALNSYTPSWVEKWRINHNVSLTEEELAKLLLLLRKKAPDVYRHLLGLVKSVIAVPSKS